MPSQKFASAAAMAAILSSKTVEARTMHPNFDMSEAKAIGSLYEDRFKDYS